MKILGHEFNKVMRVVYLENENGTAANPRKKLYIVMEKEPGEKLMKVSTLNGRAGTALRKTSLSKGYVMEHVAHTHFNTALNKAVSQGYAVQLDESYSGPQVILPDLDEDDLALQWVWEPIQYASNPIREMLVNISYDLSDYAVALIPKSKRMIIQIQNGCFVFYNHHGGVITSEQSEHLMSALSAFKCDIVLDGFWDGEHYFILDSPSEDDFEKRYKDMLDKIVDFLDNDVIQLAEIYFNQEDINAAMASVHTRHISHIAGIKKTGSMRPGQKDGARIQIPIRPRAVLEITGKAGKLYELGVDDGLGFITVAQIAIEHEMCIGTRVVIEYESWKGHGSMLENAVFVEENNDAIASSFEQLLTLE